MNWIQTERHMINGVKNVEKFKCGFDEDQRNNSITGSICGVKIAFLVRKN